MPENPLRNKNPLADRPRPDASLARDRSPKADPRLGTQLRSSAPTALIVEFRDEVYASLEAMLVEEGFVVRRAGFEAAVPACINRLKPDLVLIYAEMPHESGWLVACKLTFSHPRQAVWLYGAADIDRLAQRQSVCGIDEFIVYDGVLLRLVDQLRQAVRRSRPGLPTSPAPPHDRPVDGAPQIPEVCVSDLHGIAFQLCSQGGVP